MTVHTSDLDHAILAAVHTDAPHADSVTVGAVAWSEDGTPVRYRAVMTINRSGEAATAVEALAGARFRLRAATGAEQVKADRDRFIANTVNVEDGRREADAAIERVRALHSPEEDPRRVRDCKGCRTTATYTPYQDCKTLAALNATEVSDA